MQQLDIFNDSRDRVLINQLADALAAEDVAAAHGAAQALHDAFPAHRLLPAAALLTATLQHEAQAAATPWPAAAGASALAARQQLAGQVAPAARDVLGSDHAQRWLAARWRALARRAAALPCAREHADAHAAALWLQAGAWADAARAAEAIESWRHRPLPLAWAAQARWHLQGVDAAWPLLAELAWLAPARVAPLLTLLPDAGLRKLARRFETDAAAELCAELSADPATAVEPAAIWAWWPVWLLVEQPLLAAPLANAQPQRDSAAERAFGLLRTLLHLERQGRHAERVAHRRQLAELSPTLFRNYMATR